jgi:hypothetical protein
LGLLRRPVVARRQGALLERPKGSFPAAFITATAKQLPRSLHPSILFPCHLDTPDFPNS